MCHARPVVAAAPAGVAEAGLGGHRPEGHRGCRRTSSNSSRKRARIEQLYDQAREMSFGAGRAEKEQAARAAEEALERQVRELPGSEQRELQNREQARGLDPGGPSR